MKITFKDKMRYRFDNLMAKGTVALVGVLFLATAIVIVGVGIVLSLVNNGEGSVLDYIWSSLMHVIDAGTITAADTKETRFVILMSLVTLCGIFVTSILIGIITTGFEEKLNNLKKGNSRVIEKDHVVILGFDSNVYTLISEIVTANENQKKGFLVILTNQEKETVDEMINSEIQDLKTTKVITRTGCITDKNMLSKCSLESCKSIIINEKKDFMTIKTIIAINNYFESIGMEENLPHIVATINKEENLDTISIISKGNVEAILVEDAISRIIAQSSRQPGLSTVLVELFDYDGDELYFESFEELNGVKFGDALNRFEKAIVFGFERDNKVFLNPDKNILIKSSDKLILLVEDDGVAKTKPYENKNIDSLCFNKKSVEKPENIMIIGINNMINSIIIELDNYLVKGSKIFIANKVIENSFEELEKKLKNISITTIICDTDNRENLNKLTSNGIDNFLLLSDYESDDETSDALTLFKLIHLRDIAKKCNRQFNITSEMRDTANQRLAEVAKVNDLVVGSNIINLILSQICQNRSLSVVFQDLLNADGSEIYIKKAENFVKLNEEIDFHDLTQIIEKQNAIAIGYKKKTQNDYDIIINPSKSEKFTLTENDYVILLCED